MTMNEQAALTPRRLPGPNVGRSRTAIQRPLYSGSSASSRAYFLGGLLWRGPPEDLPEFLLGQPGFPPFPPPLLPLPFFDMLNLTLHVMPDRSSGRDHITDQRWSRQSRFRGQKPPREIGLKTGLVSNGFPGKISSWVQRQNFRPLVSYSGTPSLLFGYANQSRQSKVSQSARWGGSCVEKKV